MKAELTASLRPASMVSQALLSVGHVHGRHSSHIQTLLHYPVYSAPASLRPIAVVAKACRRWRGFHARAGVHLHPVLPVVLEPLQDLGRPAVCEGAAEQQDTSRSACTAPSWRILHRSARRPLSCSSAMTRYVAYSWHPALPCHAMASTSALGASSSSAISHLPAALAAATSARTPNAGSAIISVRSSREGARSARMMPRVTTAWTCSSLAERLRSSARHASLVSAGTYVVVSVARQVRRHVT